MSVFRDTMSVEEAEATLARRCPALSPDGDQCGDYRGHVPRRDHSLLVCTVFLHATAIVDRETQTMTCTTDRNCSLTPVIRRRHVAYDHVLAAIENRRLADVKVDVVRRQIVDRETQQ